MLGIWKWIERYCNTVYKRWQKLVVSLHFKLKMNFSQFNMPIGSYTYFYFNSSVVLFNFPSILIKWLFVCLQHFSMQSPTFCHDYPSLSQNFYHQGQKQSIQSPTFVSWLPKFKHLPPGKTTMAHFFQYPN